MKMQKVGTGDLPSDSGGNILGNFKDWLEKRADSPERLDTSVIKSADVPRENRFVQMLLETISRFCTGFFRGKDRNGRLILLQRIALGPRNALSLIEAQGVQLLVATSGDGAPTVFLLPSSGTRVSLATGQSNVGQALRVPSIAHRSHSLGARISW